MTFTSPSLEISTDQLAQAIEAGEPVQVLDVRAPARLVTGRIDLVPDERFHNVVGSQVMQTSDPALLGLAPDVPVAVVCGFGNDSRVVARHLSRLGLRAQSLRGGMAAWMNLTRRRDLPVPPSLDHFAQFDRIGKGALGYLLVSDGAALIVDPPRDPAAYLERVDELNAEVVAVADTHVHADYISGAPAVARQLGVPYYLHPADAVYPYDGTPGRVEFQPLSDGQDISVGRCVVKASHTPGHTEGSITYVIDESVALTGDFLFVASIGRPDLAGKTREWTARLWESVRSVKATWSPDIVIYPAHYGSDSERRDDRSVGARLGDLLRDNPALRFETREEFCAWVEGHEATFPEAYRVIKAVNVGLLDVTDVEAQALEAGKNECALSGA